MIIKINKNQNKTKRVITRRSPEKKIEELES